MVVPAPIEGSEMGLKPRAVLVVEDEVLIRMMISEGLRNRGCHRSSKRRARKTP